MKINKELVLIHEKINFIFFHISSFKIFFEKPYGHIP